MILEDYDKLNELLEDFRQEEAEIDILLAHHLRCIKKADIILKDLKDSEPDDYKVFSPRKAEVIHREEIEQAYKEKSIYEEKNRELYRKKDVISGRIAVLENILSHQDNDSFLSDGNDSEEKTGIVLQEQTVQSLKDILAKIENGSKYLEQNQTIQARQEFIIVKRCLANLMEDIMEGMR